ncbi:MAG TPA: anti-sigma factor [Vicinamibacterales bacterium]|nr:anti-sigma factor [Vicinamibacterales bacterium]
MAEPVDTLVRKNEPRDPDLQSQVEELRLALQDWRRKREYSQATEERLAKITVQCARMVESWQQMEQRRSALAGPEERDGDRGDAGGRQAELGERLHALDRTIEHEWEALPAGEDERASLAESCVVAAELTLRGFARTESRLAALEQDLQARMAQLSSDLQSVVTELRSARPPRLPGAVSAFPLESVMRIHEELRETDGTSGSAPDALKAGPARALAQGTESATALTARVESLERAVATGAETADQPRSGWRPLYSVVGLLVVLAGVAFFGLWMQRRVDARLNEAALRVSAAERQRDATTEQTNARLAATREEAAREVAAARQSAAQAQIVGNVLAAPDLVRYWLTGADPTSRAYGQVLFSRSRGIVFSASRMTPAGDGKTYQLWLLSRSGPVSAGLVTPDSAGRVTLTTEAPLDIPSRVAGALVTLEPAGGGSEPSAERVLIRVEPSQ